VISPAGPDRPVQWIDARDLANLSLHLLELGLSGPYNVISEPTTLRHVLGTIRSELNPTSEFVELEMEAYGIAPWTDLPLVVEPGYGTFQLSTKMAVASGLNVRTLSESVRDTYAWWREQGRDLKTGLSAERHAELLAGTVKV
jgi:nucleoside-diphosphate-sugar epimerase